MDELDRERLDNLNSRRQRNLVKHKLKKIRISIMSDTWTLESHRDLEFSVSGDLDLVSFLDRMLENITIRLTAHL